MKITTAKLCLAFVFIGLAGCQAAATEVPAVTPTSIPPTAVLTPTPLPPTATSTPRVSPTPIPTESITLAGIIGTWTRADPDRGTLFLIFQETGDYIASHGSPEGVMHSGKYDLEGRILSFVNGWDCSPLGETEGKYNLRMGGGGKILLFDLLDDECPDRPSALKGFRWDRVETTP